MFYDLCLGQEAENQFVVKDKLAMAILLGYDCTAVNRNSDYGFLNRCALTTLFGAFQEACCSGPCICLLHHARFNNLSNQDKHVICSRNGRCCQSAQMISTVSFQKASCWASNSDSSCCSGSMEGSKVAPELMQSLGPAVQSALLSHQGLVRPTGLPPRQMAQLSRVTFEGDHGMAAAAAALQLPGSRLRQTFDIVAIKPNSAPALVKVSTRCPAKSTQPPLLSLCALAACLARLYTSIVQGCLLLNTL